MALSMTWPGYDRWPRGQREDLVAGAVGAATVEVAPAADEASDGELVARIARGDEAALGRLYDRYAGMALGLARRIVQDPGVAEEVVQDAFVAAWRRVATYHPDRGEPRSW